MSTQTMQQPVSDWAPLIGRCYMNPFWDYALIGSAVTIPAIILVLMYPELTPESMSIKRNCFLLFNYAHFASSAVRLYTKPGDVPHRAFASYGLPGIALFVTTVCIMWPELLGKHLWALAETWSPYHYAAQAYGLALMYCFRSGCILNKFEKRLFWGICMLPFVRAFLLAETSGLAWFVDVQAYPGLADGLQKAGIALAVLIFALPNIVFFMLQDRGKTLPLIAWLIVATNGLWWVTLSYSDAWFWATIFHSLQYLVIICIVHTQDKMKQPGNTAGPFFHVSTFYVASFFLGMFLFLIWPQMYGWAGFNLENSILIVWGTVNLHHFIVDGYIWRSTKKPKPGSPTQALPATG